ncbi:hypothetical protein [Streptomyces collinus]|uniref:hypothetical protein n=1 Tax=Streptomyces collinus TaxID=42684 RepID=UPI003327C7C5
MAEPSASVLNAPPKYELRDVVPVTMTITDPDSANVVASAVQPLVLVTIRSRQETVGRRRPTRSVTFTAGEADLGE